MAHRQQKDFQDPTALLQAAVEELDLFTQSQASRLGVGEDGRLIAAKETRLKRVIGLAQCYIGPLFSDHARQKQERKHTQVKQAILHARDIIQSHSALIEKFKQGNDSQRKLAEYALEAIQRYNAVVAKGVEDSGNNKYDVYNYERNRLLSDQEIKGYQIELPHALSIKYDSHPDAHPAQKMLKELSETLLIGAANKQCSAMSPTHKKTAQFMIDTFRMKAIRMVQTHLVPQSSIAEVLPLFKQAVIEIDEESDPDVITMRQLVEIGPGSVVLLVGCFKRNLADPKFMTMPILDSFRFSSQLTHTGFPYPSQHMGWALADKWVEACPLRADQVPLFQQVEQRRKRLAQHLLFDQALIHKARRYAKLKREAFDHNRALFLTLHRQLQQLISQEASQDEPTVESVLDAFYHEAAQASSAFDILVQTQQQLLDLFIRQPLKALEDEWLGVEMSPLRIGSPQERFDAACRRFDEEREQVKQRLNPTNVRHAYILQQGPPLSRAFQAVVLQYQSEKMGFAPPLLTDLERRLQVCAFHQLLMFMDECEHQWDHLDLTQIECDLLNRWTKDLQCLQDSNMEDEQSLALSITNELEAYFNSRFYVFYSRHG